MTGPKLAKNILRQGTPCSAWTREVDDHGVMVPDAGVQSLAISVIRTSNTGCTFAINCSWTVD